MADLWWENNTRVMTPTGHEGRLRVTRRERSLIAYGKKKTANVLGLDGLQRTFNVDDLTEIIPEVPENTDV